MRVPKHTAATAAVVVAALLASPPALAFSVHIGSFHITITPHGHRHHHSARGGPAASARPAAVGGAASPLFYPQLALPDVMATIFSSPPAWPFDDRRIVVTAFTRRELPDARACAPQSNLADRLLTPLDAALGLTDAQAQLLDKLGDALDAAQNSLVKSCPDMVPAAPAARLQLADSQIGQLTAALGGMRQPLQAFQHALTDEQLARSAAMIAPASANNTAGPADVAPGCGGDTSSATDQVVALIEEAVAPTASQRDALNVFKGALDNVVKDMQADCAAPLPPTELGRLGMIEIRLDTARRAARSIAAALTKFKAALSDEQKARLDAASFATH